MDVFAVPVAKSYETVAAVKILDVRPRTRAPFDQVETVFCVTLAASKPPLIVFTGIALAPARIDTTSLLGIPVIPSPPFVATAQPTP